MLTTQRQCVNVSECVSFCVFALWQLLKLEAPTPWDLAFFAAFTQTHTHTRARAVMAAAAIGTVPYSLLQT